MNEKVTRITGFRIKRSFKNNDKQILNNILLTQQFDKANIIITIKKKKESNVIKLIFLTHFMPKFLARP